MRLLMRRWIILLLGVLLLGACGSDGGPPSDTKTRTLPTATAEPAVEPTAEPAVDEQPIAREITYDHHLIPALIDAHMDDTQRAYYRELVDAVLVGETEIPFTAEYRSNVDLWRAGALFSQMNPLGSLVQIGYTPDGTTVTIYYYFDEAEHGRMVDSIAPRIEQLVAELVPVQANELDAVVAVYEHLARTTTYSQEGPLTGPYGVLIDGTGMCIGIGNGMTWLLAQAGFDIAHPAEWVPDDPEEEGHAWALVELDGAYFHFDPTWENGMSGGRELQFFGMTDEERLGTGTLGPFDYMLLDDVLPTPDANDQRFAPLRDTMEYSFDPVRHQITAELIDGSTIVFSTEALSVVD